MPPNIDYPGLMEAISHYDPSWEKPYYFDTQTGQVIVITGWHEEQAMQFDTPGEIEEPDLRLAWYRLWQDGEIGEELPEAELETMAQQAQAYLDRFIPVPTADSHESYQDMVDFVDTVADAHLRQLLEVALHGSGAFRRFKDVLLGYPEERERWFAFNDRRLRERVDDWLRQEGIKPDKPKEK